MPRLFLLRHAKSDWTSGAKSDFDRPLNPRGKKAAPLVGSQMAKLGYKPDRVICSPAVRTRQTLELILPELGTVADVSFPESLYEHGGEDYLTVIRSLGKSSENLLLLGHNPHIGQTALDLIGAGDEISYQKMRFNFPTSALAAIEFERPISNISPSSGVLLSFILPRELNKSTS